MLILAASLIAALGFVLTTVGLRGRRINDHPLCAACGFDLIGTPYAPACPECGHELKQLGSMKRGQRVRRRLLLALGVFLLCFDLGLLAAYFVAEHKNFDWNTIKPAWMLESQGRSDPNPTAQDAALGELAKRIGRGELDKDRTLRLVTRALVIQADTSAAFLPGWGTIVESARLKGLVTDQDWATYARNAFPLSFIVMRSTSRMNDSKEARERATTRGAKTYSIGAQTGPTRIGNTPQSLALELCLERAQGGEEVCAGCPAKASIMAGASSRLKVLVTTIDLTDDELAHLETSWLITVKQAGVVVTQWSEHPKPEELTVSRTPPL